jgi:hypothetical protein
MPQLILLAAVGAGAYAGFRWLKRTAETMVGDMQRAEVEVRDRARARDARPLGTLEYDPQTGVYRPRRTD